MDFFESLPEPAPTPPETEETRAGTGPWRRPSAVLGGSAAVDLMMIHTEDVTVALRDFHAFTNGFEFAMHVVSRVPETGARAPSAPPIVRPGEFPGSGRQERLRIGLLYADGRRGAKGRLSMHFPPPPGEVLVFQTGASGSPLEWTGQYFVHPLPPEGPVTFVTSWLAHGVSETRAQIDSAVLREAAQRAVAL